MNQNFKNLLTLFMILNISLVKAQQLSSFTITPELSQKILPTLRSFYVFHASYKEIEYHALDTGQVISKNYKLTLEEANKYKPAYDAYLTEQKVISDKKLAVQSIIGNVNSFLNSDDKYDIKEHYLIEAQQIADSNDFKVVIDDNRIKLKSLLDTQNFNTSHDKRTLMVYYKDKHISKNELKLYTEAIAKMKFEEPKRTGNYNEYVNISEELKHIKKTETGKIESTKTSKRFAYKVDSLSININTLEGKFIEIPKKWTVVYQNIHNYFKNELIDNMDVHYDKEFSEAFPLIKNIDTNDYYYVMTNDYVKSIKQIQQQQEILDIVHKLGYKEYLDGDELYIKSKTSEVKLDFYTHNQLSKNPAYINILDNDQIKIASLVKLTISHSTTLDKYLSLYNMQRNRMSTTSINAWRIATAQAQKLNDQIYSLREKYESNYSFRLIDKSNTFSIFLDNLLASKGVLGM